MRVFELARSNVLQTTERCFSSKGNRRSEKRSGVLTFAATRGVRGTAHRELSRGAALAYTEGCHTRIMGLALPTLVNENGQPLDARIQSALHRLLPRFLAAFPVLRDEAVIAGLFEDAGRRIVEAERRDGRPMDKLHGYAWVTLHTVALSHLRSARVRLDRATLDPAESSTALAAAPASSGTRNEVEGRILFAEILAKLTLDEQRLLLMKKAGYSSTEIGVRLGKSPKAVDMMFSRLRSRIRAERGVKETSASTQPDEGHDGPNRDQE